MAGAAARNRPMAAHVPRRIPVAAETKVMKAGFGADSKVCSAAAMTTDTGTGPAPVDEVVMTQNAVHLAMFVVRKAQDQRLAAPHERFAECERGASAHQCEQRNECADDDYQHEPGMPSENQAAGA